MAKPKHPPGDPMTLGNMRRLGVQRLVAYCLNPLCRHQVADRRCRNIRATPRAVVSAAG